MKVIEKISNQKVQKDQNSNQVQNEVSLLLEISHENVLRYFDHFDGVFKNLDSTFIITEYCHVSCFKFILGTYHHISKELNNLEF